MDFFCQKNDIGRDSMGVAQGQAMAIIEVFKTYRHYLESWKHEVLVFID